MDAPEAEEMEGARPEKRSGRGGSGGGGGGREGAGGGGGGGGRVFLIWLDDADGVQLALSQVTTSSSLSIVSGTPLLPRLMVMM